MTDRDKDERIAELLAANVRFEARAREAEASLRSARLALQKARTFIEDERDNRAGAMMTTEGGPYWGAGNILLATINAALGEDPLTERPIIFSAPMVRAILGGRKTMTRCVLENAPDGLGWFCDRVGPTGFQWTTEGGAPRIPFKPPYSVGDRLWVREAWGHDGPDLESVRRGVESAGPYDPYYFADADNQMVKEGSPIHMSRSASRLTLTVTAVKVERLQDISAEDAKAEGIPIHVAEYTFHKIYRDKVERNAKRIEYFSHLWNSLHGPGAWDANPWVVAIAFHT